jgi:ferredoxin
MIISQQKPLEEIRASIAPYRRLAIFGCGGCAAVCQTGGTKQVDELANRLNDKEIVFKFQIEEPCDQRILSRELRRISNRLAKVDAVLMLACGTGVQALASSIDKPCLTGLDTVFPGAIIHSNNYFENCSACGECIINMTGAICPRTLCPKGVANGPCSEKLDETCCVDSESECVWVSISKRSEDMGLHATDVEFPPVNWVKNSAPRRIPRKKSPPSGKREK